MTPGRASTLQLAVLLPAFLLGAGAAGAQTLTGTVSGRITDEQGGALPGAMVTLSGRTGPQTQVTDSIGQYRFPGVAPDLYIVKAELQGFRSKQQDGVELGIGKTIDVSLALAVGGVSETVDVIAERPIVDTSSTATDTTLSQDMLFSMPLSHAQPAVNILQYSPGVTDGSAFGGSANTGNALLLDGVDTRDPSTGSAWPFYDYNIIEEVQAAGLGQPAEYGGFTGIVVNTITKSGGNRFSFLGEHRYTDDGSWLFSDNTDQGVVADNPNLGLPARVLSLKDYTVQLGGPLRRDRLFFFGSVQRYEIHRKQTGPIRSEISPRFYGKLSFQPTPNDHLTVSFQYDQFNMRGGVGMIPGWAITSQDMTLDNDAPEHVWSAQYRKVVSPSTFFEAKVSGYSGYVDAVPVSPDAAHRDGLTGAWSGGAGFWQMADRSRNQANAAVSKYAQLAGAHAFKFGAEVERSDSRDRAAYSGDGVFYYDYGGPYLAYGYSLDQRSRNERESFYAQDQWRIGGRLTANLGVRLDRIRGKAAATGEELYDTTSLGPRVGAAWDVTGGGSSVVKASYGRLYESAISYLWNFAVPGPADTVYYAVGPNWSTLTEYDRVPAAMKYSVDTANVRQPRVDEFSVSWEQALTSAFKVTTTGIWRDWHNFINSVLVGGEWTSLTYRLPSWTGPGANPIAGTTTVPIYRWANPADAPRFLIQNTDAVKYSIDGTKVTASGARSYRGFMLVAERRLKGRWQARASWVLSKTEGTVINSAFAGITSTQFGTPNQVLTNAGGPTHLDRRHLVQVYTGYQVPWIEVAVSGFWTYQSGAPYAPFVGVPASQTKWTSALNVNVLPRGALRTESLSEATVRLEKVVRAGVHRFGFYADVQNLFNRGTVTSRSGRFPSVQLTDGRGETFRVWLGGPLAQMAGRQVTLGARWSF